MIQREEPSPVDSTEHLIPINLLFRSNGTKEEHRQIWRQTTVGKFFLATSFGLAKKES